MTGEQPDAEDREADALPLVPMVDSGALQVEQLFENLPVLAPAPLPVIGQVALGEILSDALFGDIIEMSDLIPHLFDHGPEQLSPFGVVETGLSPMADTFADNSANVLPFSIFFEEDDNSGHGLI